VNSVSPHVISAVRPPFSGEENNNLRKELNFVGSRKNRRNANVFDNLGKRENRRFPLRVFQVCTFRKSRSMNKLARCRTGIS